MEASGKASATIAIILLAATAACFLAGLAINYYDSGEWWPARFSDGVLIAFAFAGFFTFMAAFFVIGVLVSLAAPVLTKRIGPENRVTGVVRAGWSSFEIIHGVFGAIFTVVIVTVVFYAATQQLLIAAILVSTVLVGLAVTVWWRRRERRLSNSA